MSNRIEDYAIIGDTETAALVSRDGSIDWMCLPRFDSPACFASILGDEKNGHWQIAPAEFESVTRSYRGDSLILETVFKTETGTVKLTDFMSPRDERPDLIRIAECVDGCVDMSMVLVVRFDYGLTVPWVKRTKSGLTFIGGPDGLVLDTDVSTHGHNLTTVADFRLNEGEKAKFVMTWYRSHLSPPTPPDAEEQLANTEAMWREWSERCTYQGPYRDIVMRSLLTLKALTYAPTGGIVAAATTSLPEALGGERNWDYRFCWLRDATLTLNVLMECGYIDEAHDWRNWLLRAVAGRADQMQIMYGVAGERQLTEFELPWLTGYEKSQPVRVGNAASEQFQLDVYGEVMASLDEARRVGLNADATAWSVQTGMLKFLEQHWREPDDGIWEVRGGRKHFTHSKVMAWVAFDRGVKAIEQHGHQGPLEKWKAIRDEIHRDVMANGWNEKRQSFTQSYGSDALDASLLTLSLFGFIDARDEKMVSTVEAIKRELVVDGFVCRYLTTDSHNPVDGLHGQEGAFLPCTFWLVDNLTMMGRVDEAVAIFENLLSLANDLGLLAEEYEPFETRQLGNFPQAFTHVGLVNTAIHLAKEDRR